MDTSQQITHLSLCSGYGGIDLGLRRVFPDMRTLAYSEIEEFACALLASRMEAGQLDAAPIWSDLKTLPWDQFAGLVSIISGGFPCQPFSAAGKRLGDEDPRHLFPHILRGIGIVRPEFVFLENVDGIVSSKLAGDGWNDPAGTPVLLHVLRELERVGYRSEAGVFSASEVGAPHQRKRIFILAHRNDARLEGYGRYVAVDGKEGWEDEVGHTWPSRPSQPQFAWEPPRVVANASSIGGEQAAERCESGQSVPQLCGKGSAMGDAQCKRWESGHGRESAPKVARSGCEQNNRRVQSIGKTESPLGRDADGAFGGLDYAELCCACDNRTDELRLLGNGVVPACAERAFRVLAQRLF